MNRELLLLVDTRWRAKRMWRRKSCSPRWSRRSPPPRRSASSTEIDARVSINRETGDYDSFRRWTVVSRRDHEEPAYQIAITDAADRKPALALGDVIEEPLEARGVRPHWRPGGEAGDPAEDPRRRARANTQRFPRAAGQPAHGDGQADRARQRDRRIRTHRRRDSARPADPEECCASAIASGHSSRRSTVRRRVRSSSCRASRPSS